MQEALPDEMIIFLFTRKFGPLVVNAAKYASPNLIFSKNLFGMAFRDLSDPFCQAVVEALLKAVDDPPDKRLESLMPELLELMCYSKESKEFCQTLIKVAAELTPNAARRWAWTYYGLFKNPLGTMRFGDLVQVLSLINDHLSARLILEQDLIRHILRTPDEAVQNLRATLVDKIVKCKEWFNGEHMAARLIELFPLVPDKDHQQFVARVLVHVQLLDPRQRAWLARTAVECAANASTE